MNSISIPVLIGGLIPALLFGIGATVQTAATGKGISPANHLAVFGFGMLVVGLVARILTDDTSTNPTGAALGLLAGISAGAAMFGVMYALTHFKAPMSLLAPLYNCNTLVTVVLCFWFLEEAKRVNAPLLVLGAVLIVAGAGIVALAEGKAADGVGSPASTASVLVEGERHDT